MRRHGHDHTARHSHDHTARHSHDRTARHSHDRTARHSHDHTALSVEVLTSARALRAVRRSALALAVTAVLQIVVVGYTGSAGLLADALHNIGDVLGTVSLWLAFTLSRRAANDEFTYGWRRAEDLAGLLIVLAIAVSAVLAGWESVRALFGARHHLDNLGLAFLAAVIGIVGNEAVAQYKIRVGRAVNSVPLIADGQHARVDALTSAAAAAGIAGAWAGFPVMDPLAGLVITAAIVWVLIDVGRDVVRRNMDAVEPGLLPRIRSVACGVDGVEGVHDVRARYIGGGLQVQLHAEADGGMSLRDAHTIAEAIRHRLTHELDAVTAVDVHMDPVHDAGADDAPASDPGEGRPDRVGHPEAGHADAGQAGDERP